MESFKNKSRLLIYFRRKNILVLSIPPLYANYHSATLGNAEKSENNIDFPRETEQTKKQPEKTFQTFDCK